jgi:hypothetical protein
LLACLLAFPVKRLVGWAKSDDESNLKSDHRNIISNIQQMLSLLQYYVYYAYEKIIIISDKKVK